MKAIIKFQMLMRLKLLMINISSGILLLIILCLGSQNLNDRHKVNLGIGITAPLPTGFLIGTSIAIGIISGGCTTALLIPTTRD